MILYRIKMNLLREEIDSIDNHILTLLSKRAQVAISILKEKNKLNKEILCHEREQTILDRLQEQNNSHLQNPAIVRVFSTIIEECRNLQSDMRRI